MIDIKRLNEIISKDGEVVFVIKNFMVFWVSSFIGFAYATFTEPYAISLGFREPYPPYVFILEALVFGVLGVIIYLVYTGVLKDEATEKLTKKQKATQFLFGVVSAIVVVLITVLLRMV